MGVTTFVFLAGLVAAATAEWKEEIAVTSLCEEVNQEMCTIGQVRINPCQVNKPCIFKKGKNVSMEFDFTPNFSTSKLKTGAYYPTATGDLPFTGLASDDACLLTSCPTVSGTQQILKYILHIGKKLPSGTFPFKWKVWNADNVAEMCCFLTKIILRR